jgi:hypothetical protein
MSHPKKTHIGQHNKPKCVTRLSAHVHHQPSIVVPIEEFQRLPKERQCQKCAASIDTTDFARGLTDFILGAKSAT